MRTALKLLTVLGTGRGYVIQPAGFTYSIPYNIDKIIRNGDGTFSVPYFDISALAPAATKTYYVDGTAGNDANLGTLAAPYKSVAMAIIQADVDRIYIKPGLYKRAISAQGASIDRNVSFHRWPGETGDVIVTCAEGGLSWVLDGVLTNTWTTTRSSVYNVVDASQDDGNGNYTQLVKQADAATVDANPGSWYLDGSNVLWVRTTDDREPDADIWPMFGHNGLTTGDITVYMENIKWFGGQLGAFRARDGAAGQTPRLYAKNCDFAYSASNGLTVLGYSEVILQNCSAYKNLEDGFNYHAENSIIPNAIEINCASRDNGTAAGAGNDNGSSMHDTGKILRINGAYARNVGPNVADIGPALAWCLGCSATDAASDVAGNDDGFNISGTMWCDTCVATGNTTDLVAAAASTLYRYNCTYATTGGAGTVTAYTP